MKPGQAEVRELDAAAGVPEKIGRLDVAVDDPPGMSIIHRSRGLQDAIDCLCNRQSATLFHLSRQVVTVHELHDEEMAGVGLVASKAMTIFGWLIRATASTSR